MAIKQIDTDKCIGCGACTNSCSMDVIRRDYFPAGREELTPCSSACPAHVNMRGYIHLLGEGKIEEAIRLIREELPIPAVTGHVCFHPCEERCARREVDESVNINALERYVADYWLQERPFPAPRIYRKKTAVVGSGPAGLACAYSLVRMGYPVTVFEADPLPGGMLRTCIPEYRLPTDVLDAQIEYIERMGTEFRTNVAFGKDITLVGLRETGYEAVLFAMGEPLSTKIDIEGVGLAGVLWGLEFLRNLKLKRNVTVGDRVVVIGGGNVAVDAALSALRSGAKQVQIVCLEQSEEMPAHNEALEIAREEGIDLDLCWGPKRVVGAGGRVTGIELRRCLSVFDGSGAFMPCFDEGITRTIEADTVIFAIGETTDLSALPDGVRAQRNHIVADPLTLETSVPGVFASGGVVTGPGSVVEAVASGKKAAVSIDRFLRGKDLREGRQREPKVVEKPPREGIEKRQRQRAPLIPVTERKGNFREIKGCFDKKRAEQEGGRCMACGSKAYVRYLDDCMTCYACEKDCPEKAIYVAPENIPTGTGAWG